MLTPRPCGPHYLRLLDTIVGLLLTGGLPARQAAWGGDILLHQATATAAEQAGRDEAAEADAEEQDLALAIAEGMPRAVRAHDHGWPGRRVSSITDRVVPAPLWRLREHTVADRGRLPPLLPVDRVHASPHSHRPCAHTAPTQDRARRAHSSVTTSHTCTD
ncbi:hypothetical protein [Actinoplanes sp. NPDC051851]|uniref:hypothetical protein n=1 Tax=Actinoplanes sp. NPDC051851 TaxID=3154753 RepID=UPI003421CD8E